MTAPGERGQGVGAAERLGLLSDEQRQSLAALLDAAQHLYELARSQHLDGSEIVAVKLAGYADRMASDACRLAGVCLGVVPPSEVRYDLVSLEVERHTEKLWATRLSALGEKAVAYYVDGPTRPVAVALGLVLLARATLDRCPDCQELPRDLRPVCAHCGALATCLGVYEQPDSELTYACDTCCGHGNEDGHCEPVRTTRPTLEGDLNARLEQLMEAFDASLAPPAGPLYVPDGFHAHGASCPAEKANPLGICNCSQGVPSAPEPSFHGTGGFE